MRAILDAQPHRKGNDFVFGRDQGGYSGWSASKAALDAQLPAAMPAWHLHDLRHAAVTGMCESPLSVPPHIAELVVNHQSGHRAGIAGHYNHANCIPERRDALEKWGRHVMALVKPKPFRKTDYWHRPPQIILIERTAMHLGGTRPWFICSHCSRRCGKLYVTSIDVRCRVCAELGFKSQRQDRPQRLAAKAEAIRNRLNADAFGNPKRPRKMFERTFRRHLHTLAIIQQAIATRSGIASVRYRRHRERDSAGRYCAG